MRCMDGGARCRSTIWKNGQAVIARIDLTLDDDVTAIACAKQLIFGKEIQVANLD